MKTLPLSPIHSYAYMPIHLYTTTFGNAKLERYPCQAIGILLKPLMTLPPHRLGLFYH